jgi:hypothetical protein
VRERDMMYKTFFILAIIMFITPVIDAKDIPFSQEDRDRLIRLEMKVEEGQRSLQRQIDDLKLSTQRQFDNLYTLMLWGFGILFGGMGILIGFVIWDRRTALAPAIRKNKELEEREELIEKALKEYARENPKLAEILKGLGII